MQRTFHNWSLYLLRGS